MTEHEGLDDWTVPEAARALNVSDVTIFRWLKNSVISGRKHGREWRIPRSEASKVALCSRLRMRSSEIAMAELHRRMALSSQTRAEGAVSVGEPALSTESPRWVSELTAATANDVASKIVQAFTAAGVVADLDVLVSIIAGDVKPDPLFWKTLADGVDALARPGDRQPTTP